MYASRVHTIFNVSDLGPPRKRRFHLENIRSNFLTYEISTKSPQNLPSVLPGVFSIYGTECPPAAASAACSRRALSS